MASIREKLAEPVDPTQDRFTGQERGSELYLQKNPPRPVPINVKQDQEDITIARNHDTWVLIIFVRMLNAITICTFFQPDEYYQALEPAWALAFGKDSGAWMTWEWQHQLRSSLHPLLISIVYKATAAFSDVIFPPVLKTKYLVLFPKFALAMQAVVMDFYTWALSEKIFGQASTESTIVVCLCRAVGIQSMLISFKLRFLLLSPWQWFMSTRAFSNTLETALTAMALYYWPWEWMKPAASAKSRDQDAKK
jgi:phosphatidylinositol glycan class B